MSTHSIPREDNIRLAVTTILLTVLALSIGDALIKATSAEMVLWQIFVLRSLLAVPILLVILRLRFSSIRLLPRAPGWTALRSLMLALMWVSYYAALPHLQLSIAAAVYYTLPIFITLFSAAFTADKVGPVGWLAILLGFVGVMLILKPSAEAFNLYALLPLISAMLYALAMILTRTKCRDEHPLILSAALNLTFIAVGVFATMTIGGLEALGVTSTSPLGSFLSADWSPMAGKELLAVLLMAIAILGASIGTAVAYQKGPSAVIATFDFAYVGFAALWGFLFFAEVPDALSLAGMILIVVAGVITVRR